MSASKKPPLTFDPDIGPASQVQAKTAAAVRPAKAMTPTQDGRIQVGTRVSAATYRQLKAHAGMTGEKVQNLVELAITEFLANHPHQG